MTIWERRATLPLYGPNTLDSVVNDGDTCKLMLDMADGWRAEKWIRLSGVRAPETTEPGIEETRQFVKGWLAHRYGLTRAEVTRRRWPFRVVLETDTKMEPDQRVSFTRWVGEVYDWSTGESLNERMRAFLAQHPQWPAGRETLAG